MEIGKEEILVHKNKVFIKNEATREPLTIGLIQKVLRFIGCRVGTDANAAI